LAKRVGVIDIGSNSVRMVIYEKTSRFAFHLLHEEKSKVRISENAYEFDGVLQEIPMQRTIDALENFLSISKSFKVRKLLCVATSALRDAPNKKEFLDKVKHSLKLNIKVISGEKEAYYGGIACLNLLPKQNAALTIDIGGGSTEFSFLDDMSQTFSLKLGTVRLKELFFDKGDIKGATAYIDKELLALPSFDVSTLVGIGGTLRAISSSILKNSSYPLSKIHGYEYSVETLETLIEKILNAEADELSQLNIKNNRVDVIKPGSLILQRVLKMLAIKKIITSGVGVREGVYLADLLRNSKHRFPHNYNTSVRYIIDSHIDDLAFSNNLSLLSKRIFDLTSQHLEIEPKYRSELAIAAKLYPSGSSVHFYSQNKHTYYLIQSALEYGFTHSSITLIATLTKYAKSRLPAQTHLNKYAQLLPEQSTTNALSYILSLSITLLSHRPRNIDFELAFEDGVLSVKSKKKLYIAQNEVEKLECNNETLRVEFNS